MGIVVLAETGPLGPVAATNLFTPREGDCVHRRRKKKILPLIQYRGRARTKKENHIAHKYTQEDPVAEILPEKYVASSFAEMLRGDRVTGSLEIKRYVSECERPAWDATDLDIACRAKAAAEAKIQALNSTQGDQPLPSSRRRTLVTTTTTTRRRRSTIKSSKKSKIVPPLPQKSRFFVRPPTRSHDCCESDGIKVLRRQHKRNKRLKKRQDTFIAKMLVQEELARKPVKNLPSSCVPSHDRLLEQWRGSLMSRLTDQDKQSDNSKDETNDDDIFKAARHEEWLRSHFEMLTTATNQEDQQAHLQQTVQPQSQVLKFTEDAFPDSDDAPIEHKEQQQLGQNRAPEMKEETDAVDSYDDDDEDFEDDFEDDFEEDDTS